MRHEKRYQIQKNKMIQYNQETQIFMNKHLNKNFTDRKKNITELVAEKKKLQADYARMMEVIRRHKL